MIRVVVDASIAPKWYLAEVHEVAAPRLLGGGYAMAAPAILTSEFTSVALQKHRRGQLTRDEANTLAARAVRLPVRLFDTRDYLAHAYALAQEFHPSVYDCLYAALGLSLGCEVVTAERPFYAALSRPFPETML